MPRRDEQRLNRLINTRQQGLLKGGRIGIEKETLRVGEDGCIAQTPHPAILGSALTHPYITTDYSEALLEFITPPCTDALETLRFLHDIHQFVYRVVDHEMLWVASMPCVLQGEASIPIAWYGTSNLGFMKHVYRRGLGYRYGRMMQVIAGVHFNYSLPDPFWPVFQEHEQDTGTLQDFISYSYFCLIRNLQRLGWLIPYLFGASPAVCKSFLGVRSQRLLAEFDANTYFEPYATSLRMSDIGYTNRREKKAGLNISYNSLDEYIASLNQAVETPHPPYQELGVVVDGEYRQLNANLLQIENEYYSSMRPKQTPQDDERVTLALKRRGVRYVELRSLDVNPFEPMGVNESELRFLETFLVYCLFRNSPPIAPLERQEIDYNLMMVASQGRDPKVRLSQDGQPRRLRDWTLEIVEAMTGFCEVLDAGEADRPYAKALAVQEAAIREPAMTPSARVLAEMRQQGEAFFHFAKRKSQQHQRYFRELPVVAEQMQMFADEAEQSLHRQRAIEAADRLSFAEYLQQHTQPVTL